MPTKSKISSPTLIRTYSITCALLRESQQVVVSAPLTNPCIVLVTTKLGECSADVVTSLGKVSSVATGQLVDDCRVADTALQIGRAHV